MDLERYEKILSEYPKFRLKQANKHLYDKLIDDWSNSTVLPEELKQRLDRECPIKIFADTLISKKKDTLKAQIILNDGLLVETVLMKHQDGRNTICVSSQVGCPLKCAFCATGLIGFKRNLTSWEIVMQVLFFARVLRKGSERVSNVVFMGMGEPFLNYDSVIQAIRALNDKEGFGLGARNFSISTAGVIEGIKKLSRENLQVNLAMSLNASCDKARTKLMPVNEMHPLKQLMKTVSEYTETTGRQVMIEYIMLKGVNDSQKDAENLADLVKGLLCIVNLISLNPIGTFKPSPKRTVKAFKETLRKKGIKATERHSFGSDIKSACGQLAGSAVGDNS